MSKSLHISQFIGRLRGDGPRTVNGLILADTEYAPGTTVPAHAHAHALMSLVVEGSFTERVGVRRVEMTAGSLLYHPPDEPHSHDFHAGGARCFNVVFGSAWLERLSSIGVVLDRAPKDLHQSKAGWLARHLRQEYLTTDTASPLAIEGLALALIGEITRSATRAERGRKPAWLIRAVEQLHARALESISLTEVAASVGVDPTHLGRTFRDHYGCTMSEYVRKLRVDFARHALIETTGPLSAIALSAGFADQAHFSRVFKQVTGLTPAAFRAANARR